MFVLPKPDGICIWVNQLAKQTLHYAHTVFEHGLPTTVFGVWPDEKSIAPRSIYLGYPVPGPQIDQLVGHAEFPARRDVILVSVVEIPDDPQPDITVGGIVVRKFMAIGVLSLHALTEQLGIVNSRCETKPDQFLRERLTKILELDHKTGFPDSHLARLPLPNC